MPEKQINQRLLDLLRCPACEDRPRVEMTDGKLFCAKCGRVYSVEDGVPAMLVEETE
ncbi:MAG: Trm112 family protein [Armatimonadota bacterium]